MMNKHKKIIVFGFLGFDRDTGRGGVDRWRSSISMFEHPEFPIDVFHVICPSVSPEFDASRLVNEVLYDIAWLSPTTDLKSHIVDFKTPWDFKEVYGKIFNFCENFTFEPETEDYFFHISVGTHVQQICVYLLTESRRFPGKILQTYDFDPYRKNKRPGYVILDPHEVPVSIRERKKREEQNSIVILKSGFTSVNDTYNGIIEDIRQAAENSRETILLLGETGTGKSVEARRIYEVKKNEYHVRGKFIEINCATISGSLAVATLFGYKKGDYSGAVHDQAGLLQQADGGMLFLDEIGELSLEVQAMLLQAIETRCFKIFGIHEEIKVDFQMVCGTNRNLDREVSLRHFREDLLARIKFWSFTLPPLRKRLDDIPALVDFFIDEWSLENNNLNITFENNALKSWLEFAATPEALWAGNLRELNHSVKKMCYYAHSGDDVITADIVQKEIHELRRSWRTRAGRNKPPNPGGVPPLHETETLIPKTLLLHLHAADRLALEKIIKICRRGGSLRDAGYRLFAVPSDTKEKNYSDLARKFLDSCCVKFPGSRFALEPGKGLVWKTP
ncbi:RNA repair transcriptional activator RtcR family protein [Treponema sp. TIM-1]|uniref:RNA repair transcriptional activator RtcR family protein n=1 Tax=Treponema sp. TIM-1 TaxID=2898417 RepID=UPI003980E7BF